MEQKIEIERSLELDHKNASRNPSQVPTFPSTLHIYLKIIAIGFFRSSR